MVLSYILQKHVLRYTASLAPSTMSSSKLDNELEHDSPHDISDAGYTGDAVYTQKAHLLNEAMQEIGMGRYQV